MNPRKKLSIYFIALALLSIVGLGSGYSYGKPIMYLSAILTVFTGFLLCFKQEIINRWLSIFSIIIFIPYLFTAAFTVDCAKDVFLACEVAQLLAIGMGILFVLVSIIGIVEKKKITPKPEIPV